MRRTVFKSDPQFKWCGIAGIAKDAEGWLWVTFYTGGESEPEPANKVVVTYSKDDGETWAYPIVIADPPGSTSAWDPAVWTSPKGELILHYNVGSRRPDAPYCVRLSQTLVNRDPIAFSSPRPILGQAETPAYDGKSYSGPMYFGLNRPFTLPHDHPHAGRSLLPLVFLDRGKPSNDEWYFVQPQSVGVAISEDGGRTWRASQTVTTPDHFCNEPVIFTTSDGTIYLWVRTKTGRTWSASSQDGGETWSPLQPTEIQNPNSRFFVGPAGRGESDDNRLIVVYNPSESSGFQARDRLVARVSTGEPSLDPTRDSSWGSALVVDQGKWIAYPDVIPGDSGELHVVYDVDRNEIRYCRLILD